MLRKSINPKYNDDEKDLECGWENDVGEEGLMDEDLGELGIMVSRPLTVVSLFRDIDIYKFYIYHI